MVRFQLRVNGIHAAWPALYGYDNPHCDEIRRGNPYRTANTSFSILQWDGDRLLRHTVVDIGLGVAPSLIEFEQTHGVRVIHEVLITHPHFDHFGDIDWIANSIFRNGRADQPRPLPVYCTRPCWEIGPGRVFPWLAEKGRARHVMIEPGRPFEIGAAQITPMQVTHSESAPGAAAFVAELVEAPGRRPRKIIFTGDFLTIPDPEAPIWRDADVCFMESNTWNPNPKTRHQSILDGLALARKWNIRRTYLVHYSGYEDAEHPQARVNRALTYAELAEAVAAERRELDVQVAAHGLLLPDEAPWP
jgi:ribonuclease BN (tRNA processing enzyme)